MVSTNKIKALYLPINSGGNKFNVLDARDLDAAFRFVNITSGFGDRTGIQFASTALNTKFKTSDLPSINDAHVGIYNAINQQSSNSEVGTYDAGTGMYANITPRNASNDGVMDWGNTQIVSAGITDSRGWFLLNVLSNVYREARRNNIITGTSTATNIRTNSAISFALGAYMNVTEGNVGAQSTNKNQALSFGAGLSNTDSANLFKFIQAYLVRKKVAGAGNHGTLSGVTYQDNVPAALVNNRFSTLYSASGQITAAEKFILGATGSIAFWIKKTNGAAQDVLTYQSNSGIHKLNIWDFNPSITICTLWDSGGTGINFNFPNFTTTDWNHIIVTRDGSGNVRMYKDNVESSSGVQAGFSGSVWFDQLGRLLTGNMANIYVFDSLITSTDRGNLAAGLEPVTNSIMHLKMNEGYGTTAWDYIM